MRHAEMGCYGSEAAINPLRFWTDIQLCVLGLRGEGVWSGGLHGTAQTASLHFCLQEMRKLPHFASFACYERDPNR